MIAIYKVETKIWYNVFSFNKKEDVVTFYIEELYKFFSNCLKNVVTYNTYLSLHWAFGSDISFKNILQTQFESAFWVSSTQLIDNSKYLYNNSISYIINKCPSDVVYIVCIGKSIIVMDEENYKKFENKECPKQWII